MAAFMVGTSSKLAESLSAELFDSPKQAIKVYGWAIHQNRVGYKSLLRSIAHSLSLSRNFVEEFCFQIEIARRLLKILTARTTRVRPGPETPTIRSKRLIRAQLLQEKEQDNPRRELSHEYLVFSPSSPSLSQEFPMVQPRRLPFDLRQAGRVTKALESARAQHSPVLRAQQIHPEHVLHAVAAKGRGTKVTGCS